ncbi:phage holin [Yersinia mollaretii]|uniref:phage holin n=1 Tax=Yersinia mollaretii TaxID=33060 RepID=UPI0011A334AF|nr:phage holin [Yersinia mollaretii]
MSGRTSVASYLSGGVLALIAKLRSLLDELTLDDWAIIIGIIIAVATFLLNAYWQRRRTRAIEKAAREGVVVMRGEE